jgi:DNA-binding LacI/PurR family transcriptional regulator
VFRVIIKTKGRNKSAGKDPHQWFSTERSVAIVNKYRPDGFETFIRNFHFVHDFTDAYKKFPRAEIWIFARDKDAASAQDYAASKRIRVPQDVGILSFGNDPQYFTRGISCCITDFDTMGYLMAHAIIGDIPLLKSTKGYVKTRAMILERRTT